MIISPIASSSNSVNAGAEGQSASRVQMLRSMQMKTNANPTALPGEQGLTIPDPDKQPDEVEANQPISPQFAALAKQRRALQVKERELAEREKALSNPDGQKDSIALARLKSEPLNVLLEAGVTYEQLTEAILANQGNSEINDLKAQLKALESGVDQKLSERDQQAEQQVLAEMRREATQLAAEGDDFEMVREEKAIPAVMMLIERTYREHGEVLDVREAMQDIEDELVKEAVRKASRKKVQSQLAPTPQPMQRHQGMRTLTNKDTASVPMDRKARALAAALGTLQR